MDPTWTLLTIEGLDPHHPERSIYAAKVDKKRLCLAYHQSHWYALDARCPHANGPLAGGYLEAGSVVCPWHRFAFDLQTGQSESGGYYVNTYPIKVKDQRLWVQLDTRKRWWQFWR
jgi:nitrite reductase/ring-hydroxylating ferredoxin subunit